MQYYQKEFKMSSRKLHCFEVSSIAPNVEALVAVAAIELLKFKNR